MQNDQNIEATRDFGLGIDFGRTAADYRRFRAGFPESFFETLTARGWIAPGQAALDIGTGTGTLSRGLAERGLNVLGVDPAAALLRQAEALDWEAGVTVAYREGRAEALDEDGNTFDLVTAGQCWHWFDRAKAAAEVFRVLKSGGRVIVAHFDWLPLSGNVVEATEDLILQYNPGWTMGRGTGLYPKWFTDLGDAGFLALESFSFDVAQPYTHEAWRGRIRASAGVKASLDPETTSRFDQALTAILAARFPEDPLAIPHRVWTVSGRKP